MFYIKCYYYLLNLSLSYMTASLPTSIEPLIRLIDRSSKILLTGPQDGDGNAICGILALQMLLVRLGKEVLSVLPETLPKNYRFLTGSEKVRQDMGEDGNFIISLSTKDIPVDRIKYNIKEDTVEILVTPQSGRLSPQDVAFRQGFGEVDLIITVESNSLEDLGITFARDPELFSKVPIINIATGVKNSYFGKINLVDPSRSSSTELIHDLFQNEAWKKHIDADLSTILLAGLITSTGSFLEPNSTAGALDLAASLQEQGARQSSIIDHLFKQKDPATLKIWGRALRNAELDPVHKISWSTLNKTDFEIAEASPEDVEKISDILLRHIQGAEIHLFFIETEEGTQLQVRSNKPDLLWEEVQSLFEESTALQKHGFDVFFADRSVGECQSEILRTVLDYQKTRHNIDPDFKLQKVKLTPTSPKDVSFPHKTADSSETSDTPHMPETIPFEAPLQPHESRERQEKEASKGQHSAEITLPSDTLPSWVNKKAS